MNKETKIFTLIVSIIFISAIGMIVYLKLNNNKDEYGNSIDDKFNYLKISLINNLHLKNPFLIIKLCFH